MHRGLGLKLNLTSTTIIASGEQEATVMMMMIPTLIRYVVVCIQTKIRSFGIHSSTSM